MRALTVLTKAAVGSAHRLPPRPQLLSRLCAGSGSVAMASLREAPARIGDPVEDVDTPALIVDLDALEGNMRRMAALLAPFPTVHVRPHAKAHKCSAIARRQMELSAAVGVCCQKLSEAEAMVAGGIQDVLVSNEVVSRPKLRRLAALALRAGVAVCVDEASAATALSEEVAAAGATVRVLVEINVGQDRCGVSGPDAALSLARHIAGLPGLRFGGIQAYQGAIQHVRRYAERKEAAEAAARRAAAVVLRLEEAGLACETVTGGGTGTFAADAAGGVYTEVQPGSYIFGDVDYGRNEEAPGVAAAGGWAQSLFVQTTVMSCDEGGTRAVLDAGTKASSLDSGPPMVAGTAGRCLAYENGGDEHGILRLVAKEGAGGEERLPGLGELVWLVPGHCDPTVNLYDEVIGVRAGRVECVWPIDARGPGR
eukprot:SM000257S08640  [mRNA]  locus=s257:157217:159600:- [translate_table: standard]